MCRLWPSCEAPEPWQGVVRQLYGHLPGKQLLWTAAEGGRWLSTQQCFFPDAACMQPDSSGSMAGADSQQPSGSVEQQQQGQGAAELSSSGDGSSGNSEGRSSSGFGPLGQALVQLGLPLAVLPGSVLAMMQKYLVRIALMAFGVFDLSCAYAHMLECSALMPCSVRGSAHILYRSN